MGRDDVPETPPTFGDRLAMAIKLGKTTQTSVERELEFGQGRIHRLLGKGKSPIRAPEPETIKLLADHLGVSYEWLAIGRGPMRPQGWAPSALEEAMIFARRCNTREDAIDAAIELHREDPRPLTAMDWIFAFDDQARRLDRAGVPRPEETARAQKKIRRASAQKRRPRPVPQEVEMREAVGATPRKGKH